VRVLVVHNAYLYRGGEDAVVDSEVAMLRKHGDEVLEVRFDNETITERSRLAVALDTVWSGSSHHRVAEMVTRFHPDVVHFHNTFPLVSPAGYWAVNSAHVPVVQTLHNFRLICPGALLLRDGVLCEACVGKVPWRGAVHKCYRDSTAASAVVATMLSVHRTLGTFRHKVDRYIALNRFCRGKFVDGGLPAERIDVKPNFVDIGPPPSLGARSGGLYVGRLSKEKGIDVMLGALKLLPMLTVDVVGTGPEAVTLEQHPRARLIGWQAREAVHARMRRAAYLIVPSIWYETFGIVVIEAFACGLPVIASRLGALSELVRDQETGILFEPGSATGLATAIAWADAHPEELAAIAHTARAEYEAKYTEGINYQQLVEIYERARDAAGSR